MSFASGNTSHLVDSSGNLLEWYRYDLRGTPVFYNGSDQQINGSALGVRHLFTGQQTGDFYRWSSSASIFDGVEWKNRRLSKVC
jgi:hypothetical protein